MSRFLSRPPLVLLAAPLAIAVWAVPPRVNVPPEHAPAYALARGRLRLAADSRFLARLEVVAAGESASAPASPRAVGQMLALANPSGGLSGERSAWVELDPRLSAAAGLDLDGAEPPGTAYGVAGLPREYAGRVRPGQPVEIVRYGLLGRGTPGTVSRVVAHPDDGLDVVFRLAQAQDWFPGTSCMVSFAALSGRPAWIPTTAPVHDGTREYVWKETAPGEFAPQEVSPMEATPSRMAVLGLAPGERVVGRGAILLKPFLAPLLAGAARARAGG